MNPDEFNEQLDQIAMTPGVLGITPGGKVLIVHVAVGVFDSPRLDSICGIPLWYMYENIPEVVEG